MKLLNGLPNLLFSTPMNSNWKAVVLGLSLVLILNTVLLGWLWFKFPGRGVGTEHRGPLRMAVELLDLDEHQQAQFRTSARKHHHRMVKINEARVALFFEQDSDSLVQQLSPEMEQRILQLEHERWRVTQEHFSEVKQMLRPDQRSDFDAFCRLVLLGPGRRHGAIPSEE